jgi:hypothetical protein
MELNADQRTSRENRPAVAITDYTDKPNNNSIPWEHFRRMTKALMKSTQTTTMTERQHPLVQQYPTVQHHSPLANLTSAASPPKTPIDNANNPVMTMANH